MRQRRLRRAQSKRRWAARRVLGALLVLAIVAAWLAVTQLRKAPVPVVATGTAPSRLHSAPYQAPMLEGASWSTADRGRFAAEVGRIVNAGDLPPETGIVLLDPRGGPPLYAHNPDLPLVPASAIKILVGATSMRALGPEFRFSTSIVAATPPAGGIISGDVWLVGSGDPELSTHDLREAAKALASAGVRGISGKVFADGSAFGPDSVETSWAAEDLAYGWAAPASAVSIDNGAIQFTVTPSTSGRVATIDILPPGAVDRTSGSILTVSADSTTFIQITPGSAPQQYVLSGQIPEGAPQKFWRSLQDPTSRAATILRTIFAQAGIRVGGFTGVQPAPRDARALWVHRSRPLTEIVRHMNFDSDNHIAEQLLRALGRHAYGIGTPENGLLTERAFLERLGADSPRLALIDGSGLSPSNRVTADVLAAGLRSLAAGSDANRMIGMYPRVGIEGTVRKRPLAPGVKGRAYGKSGYIEGATALAGYVKTRRHGVLIYVMLSNNWTGTLDKVWKLQSRVLDVAAQW